MVIIPNPWRFTMKYPKVHISTWLQNANFHRSIVLCLCSSKIRPTNEFINAGKWRRTLFCQIVVLMGQRTLVLIINNILLDVFTSCCSSRYILNKSIKTSKISLKSSYFEFLSVRHLFLKCFIMQCPRSGVVFLLVIVSLFLPPTVISPFLGRGGRGSY